MAFRKWRPREEVAGRPGLEEKDLPPDYNPDRDETLFWWTEDGYIIAHDQACQLEYVAMCACAECGGTLAVIAQINRAWQGLNEVVAVCRRCRARYSFIFDISNAVYQAWWARQLGELYVPQYDGPPRTPYEPNG